MFKTILVPTDGSPLSDKAAEAAVEFARGQGARLIALSVAEPYPFSPLSESTMTKEGEIYEKKMLDAANQFVQKVVAAARVVSVPCEAVVRQSFSPYDEIIDVAKNMSCDVIFMASHGKKGLSRLFAGSETQKVLAHTTIPVLVFR